MIIVVACSAVAYLIHESRHDGRQSHRHYPSSASRGLERGGASSNDAPTRSVLDRLLSRHEKKNSLSVVDQKPRGGEQGWVQAARDDCDDEESAVKRRIGHATQMSEVLDISRPPSAVPSTSASPPIFQRSLPMSVDTRPRVSSMLSDTSMSIASYRGGTSLRYHEPFAPVPQRSISTITSQLAPSMFSSPSSTPPPNVNRGLNGSPEPMSGDESPRAEGSVYTNGKGRLFATRSGTSMLTFEGGTKFVEEL